MGNGCPPRSQASGMYRPPPVAAGHRWPNYSELDAGSGLVSTRQTQGNTLCAPASAGDQVRFRQPWFSLTVGQYSSAIRRSTRQRTGP